ncbi:MAG: hypothetical protein HQ546_04025 [Planctomycetes bacterium]|nr:hypothetical protein [Planctomycetota bacterium]
MKLAVDIGVAWRNPPSFYRSAPFWSWNSKLAPERLCRAIQSMHDAGMGGFFMHSRYGLKTPYLSGEWFEAVSACVEKARSLDMKAYLYDEDRWPSGFAGGLVTRENKRFRSHQLKTNTNPLPAEGAERIAVFSLELDGQGRLTGYKPMPVEAKVPPAGSVVAFDVEAAECSAWYNDGAYLDTLNAEAVAEFVHVTHQAYADRFGKDFGTVIPAIFTDEPNHGYVFFLGQGQGQFVPWTANLVGQFKTRRGYDIREHLPELFHDLPGANFSKLRYDYYRTVTELFVENFTRQIGRWCDKHKIALTGHMLAEETLHSQIACVGAAMPHYEHMQWPGIDILMDQSNELATAKQTASVADQLGKERVLSELYGCTGWDWPLEGHKFVGDWQYAVGVNFRCPHLTHYSLAGGAKRDYPASICAHSPWWKYYHVVEDYFARLSLMLTQGRPVRDVLIIHPVESAWGLFGPTAWTQGSDVDKMNAEFEALFRTLTMEHYDWDFGDESLLAKYAKVGPKGFRVGKLVYQLVVVPPTVTLRAGTVSLLEKFVNEGGKVLFAGQVPTHVDAKCSERPAQLAKLAARCSQMPEEFTGAVGRLIDRRVSVTEDGKEFRDVWTMLRKVTGGQLLFLHGHDRKSAHMLRVSVKGKGPVVRWDPMSGKKVRVKSKVKCDRIEFDLELSATGSALLSLALPASDAAKAQAEPVIKNTQELNGPFEIELTEPNTVPLDYCTYRRQAGQWSQPMHSLKADELIRKQFGLGTRLGGEQQPWYLYATGVVDTAPRGPFQIRRSFHVTKMPACCKLAMEAPEDYRLSVNGKAVGSPDGYWVDEDIKTIDITSLLRTGENEILLDFDYRPDMEIEDMYLLGDFGVGKIDAGQPGQPGNVTLVGAPVSLSVGSWIGQGLDYYGAAVMYKMKVTKPATGRVRIVLPGIACTAAAIHAGGETFALPWGPFQADVTDALTEGENEVVVEVIGGRKNIMGPLHTDWKAGTGGGDFDPNQKDWTTDYHLVHHGLTAPVVVQILK